MEQEANQMTMISAYLQAEEIDFAAHTSAHTSAQRMWISRVRYSRLSHTPPTSYADSAEDTPGFYRMLKELSDELAVEALEDQNFPE